MTQLIMETESIEIKAAKRKVEFNLKWLKARIEDLHPDSAIYDRAYKFYVGKMEEQKGIMEWLSQHDELPLDKEDFAVL